MNHSHHTFTKVVGVVLLLNTFISVHPIAAQEKDPKKDELIAPVALHPFVGDHREDSMWSALYGAKSGKIYIGLCTHAEAAHFYEYDPATNVMRHIVDLTAFHDERGKGINTTGKIHVRMGEDKQGRIYFAGLNEDTGPEAIDPSSYIGPHWYRYDPAQDKVESLGLINRHFGLLGMIMDPQYMALYGLAEDGHLYKHDIEQEVTYDLGRVDDWDICRTIFADNQGDIYGSFPVAQLWKYDRSANKVIDLPNIRLQYDMRALPRTMSKPMIDRKVIWRVIEWDPKDQKAYGIMGASSTLFSYDPHDGSEGTLDYLTKLSAPQYWKETDPRQVPFATLAFTIDNTHTIYYAPTGSGSFDYVGNSWDVHDEEKLQAKLSDGYYPPVSHLVTYNLDTKQRSSLGRMETQDKRMVYGLGGACTGQQDGKIYFVGAVEEKDTSKIVGEVGRRWPFSMALISYDPNDPKKMSKRSNESE